LLTRGDDNSETLLINFNFNYYGTYFSQFLISTNGFINFDTANGASSSGNAISAFNYDLDTRTSGGIYYQNLNSQSSDFYSIKSDLNRLNSNFRPTNLFRITYFNVPKYASSGYIASFQIILASDASKSYVLLKYTSCLTGLSLSSMQALYYRLSNGQQMSNQMSTNPCNGTNVNLGGTWVFDVTFPLTSNTNYYFHADFPTEFHGDLSTRTFKNGQTRLKEKTSYVNRPGLAFKVIFKVDAFVGRFYRFLTLLTKT
jgi:hypothetical protein